MMIKLRLALLFFCIAGTTAVVGGVESKSTKGVDYVVVIDQSGSMEKSPGGTSSDPNRIRYDAASLIVDFGRAEDGFALIPFSSAAKVLFPATGVRRLDAEGKRQAFAAIDECRRQYDGLSTNILAALTTAAHVFESAAGRREAGRTRQLILLTDGQNSPNGNFEPLPGTAPYRQIIDRLNALDVQIQFIALGQGADQSLAQNAAAATNGAWFPVTQATDLLPVYLDLLVASQSLVRIDDPEFFILPGAGRLCMVRFDNQRRARLGDVTLDNRSVTGDGNNFSWSSKRSDGRDNFYDLLLVNDPEEGKWAVRPPRGQSPQIHIMLSVPVDFPISEPAKPVPVGTAAKLWLQVRRTDGGSGVADALFKRMAVFAQVTTPTGTTTSEYKLTPEQTSDGWIFKGDWSPTTVGEHQVHFKVTLVGASGTGTSSWKYENQRNFAVVEPTYRVTLSTPVENQKVPAGGTPLSIEAAILPFKPGAGAPPVPAGTEITTEVIAKETNQVVASGTLQRKDNSWRTSLDTAKTLSPGSYRVTVKAAHADYSFIPANADFEVTERITSSLSEVQVSAAESQTGLEIPLIAWLAKSGALWARIAPRPATPPQKAGPAEWLEAKPSGNNAPGGFAASRAVTIRATPGLKTPKPPGVYALMLEVGSTAHPAEVLVRLPVTLTIPVPKPHFAVETNVPTLPKVGETYLLVLNETEASPPASLPEYLRASQYFALAATELDAKSRPVVMREGTVTRDGFTVKTIEWLFSPSEEIEEASQNRRRLVGTESFKELNIQARITLKLEDSETIETTEAKKISRQ